VKKGILGSEEKEALALEVYKDFVQPAARDVGNAIKSLMLPLRLLVWGIDKIEDTIINYLEERFANTSSEKLQTPTPEITAPIMQALIYCGENETLRGMYLKLLACSMEIDKEKISHRAYVQIINQLSPFDARLIAEFRPKTPQSIGVSPIVIKRYTIKDGEQIRVDNDGNEIEDVDEPIPPVIFPEKPSSYIFPETIIPIVSYHLLDSNNQGQCIQDNVLKTALDDDASIVSASVSNLVRLGLVEVSYINKLSASDSYTFAEEHPLYKDWHHFLYNKEQVGRGLRGHIIFPDSNKHIEIKKGVCKLTQFGYNFISACILEAEYILNR